MKALIIGIIAALCLMAMPFAADIKGDPKEDMESIDVIHADDNIGTGNCKKGICWIDITEDEDIEITVDPPITPPQTQTSGGWGSDDGCRLSYNDENVLYQTSNGNVYGYDKKTNALVYDTSGLFSKTEKANAVAAVMSAISPKTPMICRVK